jgi:hypothetical protein
MNNSMSPYLQKTTPRALGWICMTLSVFIAWQSAFAAVIAPQASVQGKSYGEWSAAFWQWVMEHPLEGHPMIDDGTPEVSVGDFGKVWFLSYPFGSVELHVTIPHGTMLFIPLLNAEASDLEGLGSTTQERLENATFLADHIRNLSVTVDGKPVSNLDRFRVVSPEFTFSAPSPWIFGETGGEGTSVGDGYFLFLTPFSPGTHTVHVSGDFHFSVDEGDPFDFDAFADVTFVITVE